MQWAGVNEDAISIIRRLYATNTTSIRGQQGLTPEISIQAGAKQGSPLSLVIFHLRMEPMIQAIIQLRSGYSLHSSSTDVLVYADNLIIVPENPGVLQAMLDTTSSFATWAGLRFTRRSVPCCTKTAKNRKALPTQFHIQEGVPTSPL